MTTVELGIVAIRIPQGQLLAAIAEFGIIISSTVLLGYMIYVWCVVLRSHLRGRILRASAIEIKEVIGKKIILVGKIILCTQIALFLILRVF